MMMEKFLNRINMKSQVGFTLLELLLVLSIWSLLLLLAIPLTFQKLQDIQEQQFLTTFEHDILYVQNLSLTSFTDHARLRLRDDSYEILSGYHQEVKMKRSIPPNWHINMREINDISFNKNGTIRKAGTITITTPSSTYDIVFPPGKGRCYIVKQ